MTKFDPPNFIIKKGYEDQDLGLKGGPVKEDTRSWREKAGKRRTFGAPGNGWPEFDEEGNVVKRRTDPAPVQDNKTPKGYAYVCFECAKDAGMEDEFQVMQSALLLGTCDVCGLLDKSRMGTERARYDTLLEQARSVRAHRHR